MTEHVFRLAAASLLAAGVAAGQGLSQSVDARAVMESKGDVNRGQAVVVSAAAAEPSNACFNCHGMHGVGDAAAAFPRLDAQASAYLYRSLQEYASGARKNAVMSPIAQRLTDQQMRDSAAYYAAQAYALDAGKRDAFVNSKLLERGAELSAIGVAERGVQACVNCHGPEGRGLPPTYPYLAGQHASYIQLQLRAWRSGERTADTARSQIMADIAQRLTDEDMEAVALYFSRLRPSSVLTIDEQARGPGPQPAQN